MSENGQIWLNRNTGRIAYSLIIGYFIVDASNQHNGRT